MRTVAIDGCYATTNFGDLLLLDMLAQHVLRNGYGQVICGNLLRQVTSETGVVATSFGRSLLMPDVGLFGGGGYLHNGSGWKSHLRLLQHTATSRAWRARRVPYAIVGVGVGPKLTGLGAAAVAKMCQHAHAVAVRDEQSRDVLLDAGVPDTSIEVTADIAMGLARADIPAAATESAAMVLGPRRTRRRLGLHLQVNSTQLATIERIVRGIAEGVGKHHDEVEILWIFDHGQPNIKELQVLAHDLLPRSRFLPNVPPWTLAAILASLDLVVTTKLHVGIAAWALGVPPCACAVHPKTRRFFSQVGREEFHASIADAADHVKPWIRGFVEDDERLRYERPGARARLVERSLRNFAIVDDVMATIGATRRAAP